MPQVKFVNLSFNRLSEQLDALNKHAAHNTCWSHLKNLVLNSTKVDWASVQTLLKLLPALEELHLSLNEYDHVNLENGGSKLKDQSNNETKCESADKNCNRTDDDKENLNGMNGTCNDRVNENVNDFNTVYPQVKKLHFSGNPVNSWKEICKLGYAFPNLESLVLNECPLTSLDSNQDEQNSPENGKDSAESTESPYDEFR